MRWPGFPPQPFVDEAVLGRLRDVPVAVLADAMDRSNILSASVRHVSGPARLCGRALTVLAAPGDNRTVFQALDVAQPGDVLVVSAGGDGGGTALVGEFVALEAARRGIAGAVVDGYVRDHADLPSSLPVYARGAQPRGPSRAAQGRIGWPVAVGGVAVLWGDVVVADGEGVAVVPAPAAAAVAAEAERRLAAEAATRRRLDAGEPLTRILGVDPYPHPLPDRGRGET
ncbi:MAG: hypothetical protein K6V73_09940 [Firmicutes bacterium]|nr:hypothetical protein [Bacillota bacterium]